MANFVRAQRQRKLCRDRRFHCDDDYSKLYRFNKENVTWMAEYFFNDEPDTRGGGCNNTQCMEILLRFFADPGFQQGCAADTGISQSTISRKIQVAADHVFAKRDSWVSFPSNDEELQAAAQEREGLKHMRGGCVGAIDCTHIKIIKPHLHGDEYVNRKNVPSFNVQATVDAKERITSLDASWPGFVHDSRIWRNSNIYPVMVNNTVGAYLLGDAGYALTPWMLVPYANAVTDEEKLFNRLHIIDRVTVERVFGQLKRRFPMIGYIMRTKLENIPKLIAVAAILHNVSKYLEDPDDFAPVLYEAIEPEVVAVQAAANVVRRMGAAKRLQVTRLL